MGHKATVATPHPCSCRIKSSHTCMGMDRAAFQTLLTDTDIWVSHDFHVMKYPLIFFFSCPWKFPGSNQSYSCRSTPQQYQIQATSTTYATAHGNPGSLTHWARPEMEFETSWILVRLLTHWGTMGTPAFFQLLKNVNIILSSVFLWLYKNGQQGGFGPRALKLPNS